MAEEDENDESEIDKKIAELKTKDSELEAMITSDNKNIETRHE